MLKGAALDVVRRIVLVLILLLSGWSLDLAAQNRGSFANPAGLVAFVTDDVGRTKLRPDHTFVVRREWTKASDRLRGVRLLAAKLSEIAQNVPADMESA